MLAGAGNIWAWWNSDKAVLNQQGAMRRHPPAGAELVDMVAALAQRAGLPDAGGLCAGVQTAHAFATAATRKRRRGGDAGHHAGLTRDELAGVIAHELAHIKNRDTLTMTVTATMAGAIAMLGNMLMFSSMFGGRRQSRRRAGLASGDDLLRPSRPAWCRWRSSHPRIRGRPDLGAEISGQPWRWPARWPRSPAPPAAW